MTPTISNVASGASRVWQVGQLPWRHLKGVPLNMFVFDICYPIDIFNGLNFGFVSYFSTIVIFCYYQLHNHNLLGGGNSNKNVGCHIFGQGNKISALAIGAISPRKRP